MNLIITMILVSQLGMVNVGDILPDDAQNDDLSDIEVESEQKYNHYTRIFTGNEMVMIQRVVESEAEEGSIESKIHVAQVLLNRLDSNKFPNTVEKVIFQKNAFSVINDGRYYSVELTSETLQAVNVALNTPDSTGGALYFMVRSASEKHNVTWFDNNLEFIFKDDIGHEFFK